MAKHLIKANWNSGQLRVTIPKSLVESLDWGDVEYFILKKISWGSLEVMRFIDGQSLKGNGTPDKTGSD